MLLRLCVKGLALDETVAPRVLPFTVSVTRPIGALRVLSERNQLNLPFQRVFEDRGLRRFLSGDRFEASLNTDRLITTLMQTAGISLSKKGEILDALERELAELKAKADSQIIHGKDFINLLAWLFDRSAKEIEAILFMSLEPIEMDEYPNFQQVRGWLENPSP
jgi:hypothetical protein